MINTNSAQALLNLLITDALTEETKDYRLAFSGLMEGFSMQDLDSWRGSYDVLGAMYLDEGIDKRHALKLQDLVSQLNQYANGSLLHGYKGGTYTATMWQHVFVANYGETMPDHLYSAGLKGYVAITGFEVDNESKTVFLNTEDVEY